ncbi:N-acetylhexosamine 1-kinase [Lachnospiraceae bacterium TWA4]|nr:N-acetylhexosamine 1-kinase [Lachnospiraceae bacterium TWA4]
MGRYLHPSIVSFKRSINSEIYVDKSNIIRFTNKRVNTQQSYICVSRPRRFGKTMVADMLAAYYDCKKDAGLLFENFKIKDSEDFKTHLNQYHVIKLDMQFFMSDTNSVTHMIKKIKSALLKDFRRDFPQIDLSEDDALNELLLDIFDSTDIPFVLLIDEWDCIMRRYHDTKSQKEYLDFLRNLIKDQPYIALAYMTGILPIKKYGEHSTLNMFYEYSMMDSAEISDGFGFTEAEVYNLCQKYGMDFDEAREWYDGYHLINYTRDGKEDYSIYSPKSVVESMLRHRYGSYWNQTESYDALKDYIQMNKDGLKDAIVQMLSGESIEIQTRYFQNDMNTFETKDDVLTLLVHLGYLAYNQENNTVTIPNKEIAQEFIASIEMIPSYSTVNQAIQDSKQLLKDLWNMDEECVACGIEKAHEEISILKYNDENSLSCTVGLAFYYAREYYQMIRELPTGKGYADICFIPRLRYTDIPAVIIELKWDKNAQTAMNQIYEKNYPSVLKDYTDNLLLCGINYNRADKTHECKIERFHL